MPDRTYQNDNFYVSMTCQVYFGVSHDPSLGLTWGAGQKVYKVGQNRFVVYDRGMTLGENISNIWSRHWLEFSVKYESNLFIELVDRSSRDSSSIDRRSEKLDE